MQHGDPHNENISEVDLNNFDGDDDDDREGDNKSEPDTLNDLDDV